MMFTDLLAYISFIFSCGDLLLHCIGLGKPT